MGAKTWMLVYADTDAREALRSRPVLDRHATVRLARALFPKARLELLGDGDLSYTSPPDDEIHIGQFRGVAVVAAEEFGIDHPSQLPASFIRHGSGGRIYLHAMHSVVDWFAYALWDRGKLVRSLSLSPEHGVMEDIGRRQPFEEPYWNGEHPAVDPEDEPDGYPFAFHPLALGEVALSRLFGYQLEGSDDDVLFEPQSIALMRFRRKQSTWKFWT